MTEPNSDPGLPDAVQRVREARRAHEYVVAAADDDPRKVCICGHDVDGGTFWQHQAEMLAAAARSDVPDLIRQAKADALEEAVVALRQHWRNDGIYDSALEDARTRAVCAVKGHKWDSERPAGPIHARDICWPVDVPAAARAGEALCGFTVELDGEEGPCERPATGHRWYQDHGHEDMLDVACELHRNPGGDLIASLRAKVARVEALSDEWEAIPDYVASHYDKARVDQRHMAVAELREALADPAPVEQQDDEASR